MTTVVPIDPIDRQRNKLEKQQQEIKDQASRIAQLLEAREQPLEDRNKEG